MSVSFQWVLIFHRTLSLVLMLGLVVFRSFAHSFHMKWCDDIGKEAESTKTRFKQPIEEKTSLDSIIRCDVLDQGVFSSSFSFICIFYMSLLVLEHLNVKLLLSICINWNKMIFLYQAPENRSYAAHFIEQIWSEKLINCLVGHYGNQCLAFFSKCVDDASTAVKMLH